VCVRGAARAADRAIFRPGFPVCCLLNQQSRRRPSPFRHRLITVLAPPCTGLAPAEPLQGTRLTSISAIHRAAAARASLLYHDRLESPSRRGHQDAGLAGAPCPEADPLRDQDLLAGWLDAHNPSRPRPRPALPANAIASRPLSPATSRAFMAGLLGDDPAAAGRDIGRCAAADRRPRDPRPLMIEPWNRSKTEPNGGFRVEPLALDNPYYRSLRAERQDFALSVVTPSRRTY
jgi:ribosome modulation factor